MKKTIFLAFVALFLCVACGPNITQQKSSEAYSNLDSLFQKHQYFKLREAFQAQEKNLSEKEKLIVKAKLNSVFNEKKISNQAIETLFKKYKEEVPDSTKIQLLEIEMNNSVLLFNYKKALETTEKIIAFKTGITQEAREDYENNKTIFNILKDVPMQKTEINETSLQITKDIAGLSRIQIKIGDTEQLAVFDTGANFSVITDSLALKSDLKILDGTFKVTAITGNKVDSKIAVADSIQLGNTFISNAIFLVFPEASLSFPQANYSIDCIIGFPVIEALRELSIIKDSIFYIPKKQSLDENRNLALNFLTPVVEVEENGKSLPFTFDTGATETMLYNPYFKDYEEQILKSSKIDSVQIGGAGGAKFIKIYNIPFSGKISENDFELQNTTVNSEENAEDKAGIYGNLGKDVLVQFDTLTLNFEKMFLKLN